MSAHVLLAALDPARNVSRVPIMLRYGGCRVTALCPSDTSLAHSWVIERHVSVARDETAIVAALRELVTTGQYALTIVADEALLLALASRLEPWMDGVLPFAADAATCALVLDKNRMLDTIAARGIAIPPSRIVAAAAELPAAAAEIGYPLVLKDAVGCGGAGVRRVDAPNALQAAYASLAPAGDVTVQRFLESRPGCTDVLFDHGVPRCWTSAHMLGQWPTPLHPATIRRPVSIPGVEAMVRAVGEATKFHGLGGVDWIVDAGGNAFFLEFNARVTHVVGPARPAFGRELGEMLAGAPPKPHELLLPQRDIPVFPSHFVRALKDRRGDLLQWLPFRATSADLDWNDFGVVGNELGALAAGALRRLGGRRAPEAETPESRRPLRTGDAATAPRPR
ncbi:MAG TPA: ATP-grasp domain-containing protein [Candidatus Elarobacter sp.]|nr:ATP-grasp domain-containing protein [Candidatus Elarobacter sp.]